MVQQDVGQCGDVFEQGLDGALGQGGEGVVGRREDGERPLARQRANQVGRGDGGDQGLKATVGDGERDDGAGRVRLFFLYGLRLRRRDVRD